MEFLYLFGGLGLLILGGDYLVKGASGLALKFSVSPMLVGITVVALGTSAPELLVSVSAALKGKPDIAIGNVVGSNIANIGLILGITAMIFPIAIRKRTLSFDFAVMMAASILFYFVGLTGQITRFHGVVFLVLLITYIVFSYVREYRLATPESETVDVDPTVRQKSLFLLAVFVVIGSVALVFGAGWLVEGAEVIARNFGVSDRVIAITLVAFGTSVPELAASVIAAFRGEKDISLGNLIGSNLFNILAVLGMTALIKPIDLAEQIMRVDIWWLLATSFAVLPIGIVGMRIGRRGGALLFGAYALYIYIVFGGGAVIEGVFRSIMVFFS